MTRPSPLDLTHEQSSQVPRAFMRVLYPYSSATIRLPRLERLTQLSPVQPFSAEFNRLADKVPPVTHWPPRHVPRLPTFSHIFPPLFQTVTHSRFGQWAWGSEKIPPNSIFYHVITDNPAH